RQDKYMSGRRGQYAERGAVFYPIVKRVDLSLIQDLFHDLGGRRHSAQIRLDINNFGNLLNHDWGVGRSLIQNRILSLGSPAADAQGRLQYRLATVTTAAGPALISKTFQTTATLTNTSSDVYVMMLSFRYTFQ